MYFIVQLVNTMKKTLKLGKVTRMKLNCNNNTSSSQFVISLCLCRPGNLIPGIGATSGNTLIWSEEIMMIQSSQICGIHCYKCYNAISGNTLTWSEEFLVIQSSHLCGIH